MEAGCLLLATRALIADFLEVQAVKGGAFPRYNIKSGIRQKRTISAFRDHRQHPRRIDHYVDPAPASQLAHLLDGFRPAGHGDVGAEPLPVPLSALQVIPINWPYTALRFARATGR